MTSGQVSPRIVVRAPNWVGDAVLATPFFASLRKTCPQAVVTCLCRPLVADIFRHGPDIDQIIELDETFGRSGWKSVRANAARLRQQPFDLAISLPNSLSSALIFFLARISVRVGYRGDWRRMLLTRSLPFPKKGRRPHRVESYLQLLSLVAAQPVIERAVHVVIDSGSAATTNDRLRMHGVGEEERFVSIAPGGGQPNRMWFSNRFAELARRLAQEGMRVVLVGGPNEKELAAKIVALTGGDGLINLVGGGSLLFTAEIIRRSAVFVGNDSGLAHVAAGVDTPSVVLSGPGDPTEIAPFSSKSITVAAELFCKPCSRNYCWRKDKPLECFELIGVEEVIDAVQRQMK